MKDFKFAVQKTFLNYEFPTNILIYNTKHEYYLERFQYVS